MFSKAQVTVLLMLAFVGLAWTMGLWAPVPVTAASRSETAALAQAGLARVDSLLGADQAALAVKEARRLVDQLATDPLYGWQVEGRLGLALLRAGHSTEALPYLEAVMRRDFQDPIAHRNFAAALLATGKKGRALSEFRQAVELGPGDYHIRLDYGQVLAEFGDVRESRTQLEVARLLCPDCPEADLALAGVLLEAGQYEAAVDPLSRIMDREPTPWAQLSLAQALAGSGRDRDLLVFLESHQEAGLSAAELRLAVEAEGRLGEADRSVSCLQALKDPDSLTGGLPDELANDPRFWGRVSLNLLETGQFQEGLEAADKAISLDPDNVVYRNNRVVLLLKLGRRQEADREWEEVLRLDPSLAKKEIE